MPRRTADLESSQTGRAVAPGRHSTPSPGGEDSVAAENPVNHRRACRRTPTHRAARRASPKRCRPASSISQAADEFSVAPSASTPAASPRPTSSSAWKCRILELHPYKTPQPHGDDVAHDDESGSEATSRSRPAICSATAKKTTRISAATPKWIRDRRDAEARPPRPHRSCKRLITPTAADHRGARP